MVNILLRPWLTFDRVSGVPGEHEASVTRKASEYKDNIERANLEIEETIEACLERLGRMRPEKFKSLWAEIGFCFSIVMSQVLTVRIISDSGTFTTLILVQEYFVSGFNVILPTLVSELHIPQASQTWPANAFSLVVSCFLLVFGRLADMYGGFFVYVAGLAWLAVWSLVAGFSQNELMMDFCRGLQGLGPAAYLPSSLMLLGSNYRPGLRKNLVFSVYGACAAVGFYIGIFFAGLTAQYGAWRWYFFAGTILTAITAVTSYLTIPPDTQERRALGIKMDWLGTVLISTGLILVVFAITDSSHAPKGWATPYIYVLLVVGMFLLAAAIYVEGWVAEYPLLPFDLFCVKYMASLIIALFFFYGTLGIFLLYTTFYMTDFMGGSPLKLTAWFSPMAIGGCIIATAGGLVLHIVPGQVLVVFSGVCWIIAPLLFAIAPIGANYWAYVFPSMICATLAIDTTFNVTNIFITTRMPLRRQGLAGALINSVLQLGIAFFLGFADVTATAVESKKGLRTAYKAVFWFEVGCAAFALVILVLFVRIARQKSEFTVEERLALEEEQRRHNNPGSAK